MFAGLITRIKNWFHSAKSQCRWEKQRNLAYNHDGFSKRIEELCNDPVMDELVAMYKKCCYDPERARKSRLERSCVATYVCDELNASVTIHYKPDSGEELEEVKAGHSV